MDFNNEAVKVLKKVLPKQKDYYVTVTKDSKLGDLSSTIAFSLAKKKKKNPVQVAKELVKKIKIKGTIFSGVNSVGPYINFYFDRDKASQKIINELSKKDLIKKSKKMPRVMVEFFQPNTHKGVHIGHARTLFIGESISRILEEKGSKIIRTSYGGDIGPHVAKCLWGYMNLGLKPEGDKGEWLGRIYAYAGKDMNPVRQQEIEEINKRLYARDKGLMPIWERTKKWSINHMKKVLKLSDTKLNAFIWESEVEKKGLMIAKQLLKKKVLKESEGAVIADLTKHGLEVIVIITKSGIPLYPAKDLGLARLEFRKYKVSKVIHVVAVEQLLYFKQLFKIFELAGFKTWAKNSVHKAYELVDLKEGKMSSRSGDVVLFTELYNKMFDLASLEVQKRNPKLSVKKREGVAHKITISAMKYGMLKQSINKKISFDYKDWLSFEGNTGPYIQYSYVRAKKILSKVKDVLRQEVLIENDYDYELVKKLNEFKEVFSSAYKKTDPSIIAHYAYRLAFTFSKFYEHCPVINSEYAGSRVKIIKAYINVMGKVIHLLGLKPMNMM